MGLETSWGYGDLSMSWALIYIYIYMYIYIYIYVTGCSFLTQLDVCAFSLVACQDFSLVCPPPQFLVCSSLADVFFDHGRSRCVSIAWTGSDMLRQDSPSPYCECFFLCFNAGCGRADLSFREGQYSNERWVPLASYGTGLDQDTRWQDTRPRTWLRGSQ